MSAEFVVLALEIRDTAVLVADTQEAAVERYVIPEELANPGTDYVIWAVPKEEFDAQVRAAAWAAMPDSETPGD